MKIKTKKKKEGKPETVRYQVAFHITDNLPEGVIEKYENHSMWSLLDLLKRDGCFTRTKGIITGQVGVLHTLSIEVLKR